MECGEECPLQPPHWIGPVEGYCPHGKNGRFYVKMTRFVYDFLCFSSYIIFYVFIVGCPAERGIATASRLSVCLSVYL